MSLVLRYVDVTSTDFIIRERFLTYIHVVRLDAEGLTTYLKNTLIEYNLDPCAIVSQCYDGASVMSGHLSGVQQRLRVIAPHAIYIHCCAHVLNLVLVDSVKANQIASDFFVILESLYVFLSSSKAHAVFLAKQTQFYPQRQHFQLQRLSDTRWACRQRSVNAICMTFKAILAALEEIGNRSDDRKKGVEATGLLHQIRSFKFLYSLILFDRILLCSSSLSNLLQETQLDLSKAVEVVNTTISTFDEFRSEAEFDKLYAYTSEVAMTPNINIEVSEIRNKCCT